VRRIERLAGRWWPGRKRQLRRIHLQQLERIEQLGVNQLRRFEWIERIEQLGVVEQWGDERLRRIWRFERQLRRQFRGDVRRFERIEQRLGRLSGAVEPDRRRERLDRGDVALEHRRQRRVGHRARVAAGEVHGKRQ
jgi:hypothetical protein